MTLADALAAAMPYLPAFGYLLVISALLWSFNRVPVWLHPLVLVAGVVVRMLGEGWLAPLVTVAGGSVVFVGLVLVAARTISGATLFTIVVALALTPIAGWPGLVCGLAVAALVALVRTWRGLGKARVAWLTHDTLSGMGFSPSRGIKIPEPSIIPQRESLADAMAPESAHLRMYLAPYLLTGVAVAILFAIF